jgi:hydrogenase-4 membrane subunit HyfE
MGVHRTTSSYVVAFVVLAVAFLAVAPVHAYVDPGSASYVFQLLVGTVLGALFVIRSYWSRLKTFISRVFFSRRIGE